MMIDCWPAAGTGRPGNLILNKLVDEGRILRLWLLPYDPTSGSPCLVLSNLLFLHSNAVILATCMYRPLVVDDAFFVMDSWTAYILLQFSVRVVSICRIFFFVYKNLIGQFDFILRAHIYAAWVTLLYPYEEKTPSSFTVCFPPLRDLERACFFICGPCWTEPSWRGSEPMGPLETFIPRRRTVYYHE